MTEQTPIVAATAGAPSAGLTAMQMTQAVQAARERGDLGAAAALYRRWIDENPGDPLLYAMLFNYSVTLSDMGDLAGTRQALEQAIALKPDFMPPYINLGRVYERLGQADMAVRQWSKVVAELGGVNEASILHKTTALNQMARLFESRTQDELAEKLLKESIEIDREQREPIQHLIALRQRQLKWPVIAPWGAIDRERLLSACSPLGLATLADDPMLQLAGAHMHNKKDVGRPKSGFVTSYWAAQERPERLRVGYLSSDLRAHAVGYLMAEMFGLHDRGKVESFAYYCGPAGEDPLMARIRSTVDHWIPITDIDDAAAARRIADDGIHILVDVNGYTKDSRTKLVALKPAPVIVNWLGFPGSTGSPYHHYLIADDWIIPKEHEIYYSEKVLRLPCYQPNDRLRAVAAERPSRAEAGLPEAAMVYCCFNGVNKVTRFTFARWMTILQRVPDSVLWLLTSTQGNDQKLRDMAMAAGVAPERIVFAGKLPNPKHLARYPLADLCLDTAPYGAHTTASDILWMGVPFLTMSGRSFASRVGGSLVRAAGLPELVCRSAEEYVDRAVAMGRDRSIARRYRDKLAAERDRCTLFDTPQLVRCLEALYRQMWQEFQDGALPQPDLANLETYLEVAAMQDYDAVEIQGIADYKGWWRRNLAEYHAFRPIPKDGRLWKRPAKR
jgi:predicted O-linked N-acetylglucosamine transferase (SPINDLY family)